MISLQKIGDSAVKFVFTDSDHYLYGNGEIEVPVNSLLLVIDESEMVTFKKLSGDPFLSFRADNSNLGTKAAIEQFYKDNMVGSTGGGSGSGVTPSEVQEMIDESLDDYYDKDEVNTAFETVNTALSGKADTSDVTAVANDVSTLSGQVATKVSTTDFNAYSAATDSRLAEDEEVTAAALNDLDENKQGKLVYYEENTEDGYADIYITNDDGQGDLDDYSLNVGGGTVDLGHYHQYDYGEGNTGYTSTSIMLNNPEINIYAESEENGEIEATNFDITPLGVTINGENVLTDGIITTAVTSGSTDDEIPTAKAVYDATQSGGGVTVDSAFSRTSENPVQNKVISNNATNGNGTVQNSNGKYQWVFYSVGGVSTNQGFYLDTINGDTVVKKYNNTRNLNLVETTAITSAMTSSSTDAQVPSAKAVYDTLGGLKFVQCTQSEYSAMEQAGTLDSSTLYIVSNVVS